MALANEEINAEAERRRKEEERRKKQAPRGQTVAVPRGEVGSFSKAYQGYKFVEEGTPESRRAMNIGEFTEKEAQRRFEEKRGKDWVGQMEARVREGEPQRAREALATVAARNRAMRQEPLPSPLQEDRTLQEINLPGGGRVKFGNKTLAQMREFEAKEKERVGKEQARVAAAKEKIYADRYTAATQRYGREMDPKKRYEAELAEKGFTVPKTREEENRFNKERMADFTTAIKAKEVAKNYEKTFRDDYIAIQRGKRQARQDDNSSALRYWQEEERALKSQVGDIDPRNVTQTRRFFEEKAANEAKDILNQRFERRKKSNFAQNTSNPEAASVDFGKTPFWMTDFSPTPESYSDFVNRTRVPRIPEIGATLPKETKEAPQVSGEVDRRNIIIQSFDEDTQNTLSKIASLKETIAAEPKTKTRTRPTQEQLAIRKELNAEKEKIKAKIKELQGLPGMKTRGASESKKITQEQISILNQELSFLERL